jgi:RND family efflux transporter MFP subunit
MPSLAPTRAGAFRLTLHYKLEDGVEGTYDLGEATVYADVAAAEASASPEEDGGGTVFLKEQQWQIPFATEAAARRPLRPSIEAYATLRARPDGEVELPAPVAGRLAAGEVPFPRLGARVDRDQALAAIVPQLGQDDDRVTLELAVKRAQIDLENARIERKRLEGLFKAGAVPERRVIEARHNEREVTALKSATNRRRRNFGRVQRTDQGEGDIAVRSPLTGTIIEVNAAPGEFVVAGKTLFVTADLERLWLEVHVPEREALRLGEPSGVWFATPGHNTEEGVDEAIVEVGAEAFVAVGGRIDPKSRTLPIHYEVANPGGRFPLGVYVVAHLLTGAARDALAVPRTAVTHEGPIPVVYVQTGGELFERRPVELGTRDGDWVEIRHGIVEGERVVTRSAYAIRLAGAAGAVPAHGHAH